MLGCDNGGARKKFDKFEFLRDKPTGNMVHLSDDAPQPTPGVLYIDVTRSAARLNDSALSWAGRMDT